MLSNSLGCYVRTQLAFWFYSAIVPPYDETGFGCHLCCSARPSHIVLSIRCFRFACRVVDMDVCANIAIAGLIIVGIIAVFGIIGNILTFVIFWKGNFKSSTSFLFLSLSLIDSAVLLTVFVYWSNVQGYPFRDYIGRLNYYLGTYLWVYMLPLKSMAEAATIWLTVLVAVNRYIIVCRPLRATQWCTLSKVKIQLAVVLVLVVLYNIPQIFMYRVGHFTVNNGTSYLARIELMGARLFPKFYYVYDNVSSVIMLVCLPLCILTF